MSKLPKSRDPMPTFTGTTKRTHIWLLYALGQNPTEIHKNLQPAYTRGCPSYSTVCTWHNNFKTGHLSFEDESHTGWHSNETYEYYGDAIERLVKQNPFVTLAELAKNTKSTVSDVWNFLHNQLEY
ncbi:hypothetical protein IWQ62_004659, partial [Dispira parvispora]